MKLRGWLLPTALPLAFLLASCDAGVSESPDTEAAELSKDHGLVFRNGSGQSETLLATRSLDTSNGFFQDLGTNGRACVSCHRPSDGFSITPAALRKLFMQCETPDPDATPIACAVFRTNDGSNSPSEDTSTRPARQAAYSMLLTKGLIRVGIGVPASAEFELAAVDDPYGYATASELSLFRRPLPTTNLTFNTVVMWDGRETLLNQSLSVDLASQSNDATLGHAQAKAPLTTAQQASIVAFERSLVSAQSRDDRAGDLTAAGGGPVALSRQAFSIGENIPAGPSFDLYESWASLSGPSAESLARLSIARGEALFSTKVLITTPDGKTHMCSGCHNSTNAGSFSSVLFVDVRVSGPEFRTTDLPLYTLRNKTTLATVQTTDPGRALVTGVWDDVNRFKVPVLRNLAARPPYFHNGSAATLEDVIDHYAATFKVEFTDGEKHDLAAFLRAL
jgi:cytochrome c peroxidase